jgi:tetratricopeptide (TPR) repeat protein
MLVGAPRHFSNPAGNRLLSKDPHVLFDSHEEPPEAPGHRSFLRRARQQREHRCEVDSQLALAAFLVASLVDRMHRATQDSDDSEGYRWQLRSTRHFIQELPENHAECAHLGALIDAMDQALPPKHAAVRMSLVSYAYFLNQEARLEEALDILELAAKTHDGGCPAEEYASIAMFVGRVNRRLARFPAAERAYREAQSTAEATGDHRTALFSQLGMANLHRTTGDLARSQKLVEEVLVRCRSPKLADVRSAAYSDLSAVFERQGRRIEAVAVEYQSFVLAVDDASRWRTLANLGASLAGIGEYDAARCALQVVAARSQVFDSRTNAVIELLGLASAVGDELGFRRYLREAEGRVDAMPPSMTVDFHYQAGVGMARFGHLSRARTLLATALGLAEEHQLNTWYFKVDRVMQGLAACADLDPGPPVGDAQWDTSALREVTSGLQEFATANL